MCAACESNSRDPPSTLRILSPSVRVTITSATSVELCSSTGAMPSSERTVDVLPAAPRPTTISLARPHARLPPSRTTLSNATRYADASPGGGA